MMGTWKEYIERQRDKYTGRAVRYNGHETTVETVDYNGALHIKCVPGKIESPTPWANDTIAVDVGMVEFI